MSGGKAWGTPDQPAAIDPATVRPPVSDRVAQPAEPTVTLGIDERVPGDTITPQVLVGGAPSSEVAAAWDRREAARRAWSGPPLDHQDFGVYAERRQQREALARERAEAEQHRVTWGEDPRDKLREAHQALRDRTGDVSHAKAVLERADEHVALVEGRQRQLAGIIREVDTEALAALKHSLETGSAHQYSELRPS